MNVDVMATGDCNSLPPPEVAVAANTPTATNAASTTTADGGLGYSRHYAQRIRDLGQTSKDSWIKRLWNHMFGTNSVNSKKVSNVNTAEKN